MKHTLLAFLAAPLLALALPSCSAEAQNPDADPVFDVEADDPVMDAAIAEAGNSGDSIPIGIPGEFRGQYTY